MHYAPVRKNLTHEYQPPATPEAVCAALQRLSEAIPGVTVSHPAPDEARVEGPGVLIRVKLSGCRMDVRRHQFQDLRSVGLAQSHGNLASDPSAPPSGLCEGLLRG